MLCLNNTMNKVAPEGIEREAAGLVGPAGASEDDQLRQWAASRIHDKNVLAVWRPEAKSISKLKHSTCIATGLIAGCVGLMLTVPCVVLVTVVEFDSDSEGVRSGGFNPWLSLFFVFPIGAMVLIGMSVYCCAASALALKKAEVYVVTRTGVCTLSMDYVPPGCLCCSTGVDHTLVPWSQVLSIRVNQAGRGCKMVQIPSITIILPGSNTHRRVNSVTWLVEDPAKVAAYLQQSKQQFEFQPLAAAMGSTMDPATRMAAAMSLMYPQPVAHLAEMRIFCILAGDPSKTGIIAVTPDLSGAQIAALAGHALGVPSSDAKVLLSKNGKEFPFTSAATLAPNDEIVLHA